jgi:hypothetical protein
MHRDSYGKRTEMPLQEALSRLKGHFIERIPKHILTSWDSVGVIGCHGHMSRDSVAKV